MNNMQMISSHSVFNIPFGLAYDKSYPFYTKNTCFVLLFVIVNLKVFD